MGIINITPDSFSDGGQYFDPSNALSRAIKFMPVSIKPVPIKILLITPSPANNIRSANDRRSSLIQKGIIRATIKSLAELGFATFAI